MRRTIISLFLVLSVVMPAAAFNRTQKTMTTKTASVLLPIGAAHLVTILSWQALLPIPKARKA